MANVIDALVMTLGLDTKDFDKGYKRSGEDLAKFKKQSDAVAKGVAEGGRKMAEGFSAVKTQLIGVLALLGASVGLKDFIASNVQGQASLGRLATNLDMSGRRLAAWGQTAKEMGGKAEDAFGALQAVAGGLAEASIHGQSAFTQAAAQNGIILTGAKTYEEVLLRISARLKELPRQQAMSVANSLGVGGMFNELELGPAELQKRLAAAEKRSKVTPESIAAAQKLQAAWADVQQRFTAISETAFIKVWPTLEKLVMRFANWLDSVDWTKVVDGIEKFVEKVNDVVEAFGGWKTVAIALGAILGLKLLSPVLGLVGGLGRMIPLLASSTAGMWALAAAASALAGAAIGTGIYHGLMADNASGRGVGALVANVVSAVVGGDAREATATAMFAGFSDAKKKSTAAAFQQMSPAEQAASPFASVIGAYIRGQPRGKLARGVRNNNPGNLNFAGQTGAHLESGPGARFAAFDNQQDGIAALVRQLVIYSARGTDTISGIVNKYAPAADGNNVKAYIAALTKGTGKGANDKLDLSDMGTLVPLVRGIVRHEGNGTLTNEQIMGGVRMGAQQRLASRGGSSVSSRSSEVHIAKIEVNTAATDARGIAADLGGAMANNSFIAQANGGMN